MSAPLISIPITPNLTISANATSQVVLPTLSRHVFLKHDGCGSSAVVFFDLAGRSLRTLETRAMNLRLLNGERFEGWYQVLTITVSPGSTAAGATAATCSWTLQAGR